MATKVREIGIEIGSLKNHDDYFIDQFIKEYVHYYFLLDKSLF
jgi:hypothetical protein